KKAEALAKKQEAEQEKEEEEQREQEEEEEEIGDACERLKKSLFALKTSPNPYYFLVCDVKPFGVVVSKKDIRKSMQHKKELSQVAGGSTRTPKCGECHFESGNKLVFEMEKPTPGLARILQKWLKEATGVGYKVMVGTESADDEEEDALA